MGMVLLSECRFFNKPIVFNRLRMNHSEGMQTPNHPSWAIITLSISSFFWRTSRPLETLESQHSPFYAIVSGWKTSAGSHLRSLLGRRILETSFGDAFWRRTLEANFGDEFWRRILETNLGCELSFERSREILREISRQNFQRAIPSLPGSVSENPSGKFTPKSTAISHAETEPKSVSSEHHAVGESADQANSSQGEWTGLWELFASWVPIHVRACQLECGHSWWAAFDCCPWSPKRACGATWT